MEHNPFILQPYISKDLFCDREKETETIISFLKNGRNVTLISPRRLGKTGLILRVFDELESTSSEFTTIYADINATSSVDEFISVLAESIVGSLKTKLKISKFLSSLGGVRPLITYDPITSHPQVTITYLSDGERKMTLRNLLQFLESSGKKIILAIDEFQQIREYEGVNMEAELRSVIQHMNNVRFIFSGSRKHMMADMFTNAKKPFYESATPVYLEKLDPEVYGCFIREMFSKHGRTITDEALKFVLDWTKVYTFYTQNMCNMLFATGIKRIGMEEALDVSSAILGYNQYNFLEIRRLVTPAQWKVMRALAKEDNTEHPTASSFLSKYGLTSGPAVLRALDSLVDKDLVLAEPGKTGTSYCVYNVFLSRYLETVY